MYVHERSHCLVSASKSLKSIGSSIGDCRTNVHKLHVGLEGNVPTMYGVLHHCEPKRATPEQIIDGVLFRHVSNLTLFARHLSKFHGTVSPASSVTLGYTLEIRSEEYERNFERQQLRRLASSCSALHLRSGHVRSATSLLCSAFHERMPRTRINIAKTP
jgi:hypothetical protein